MLIAYLTADEVNQDLAARLAEACGMSLYLLTFQETPLEAPFDAVLYDWDYLPAAHRERIQADLLAAPPPCPVAAHGYDLDERQASALRQHGVDVRRRLNHELLLHLGRAACRAKAAAEAHSAEQYQNQGDSARCYTAMNHVPLAGRHSR